MPSRANDHLDRARQGKGHQVLRADPPADEQVSQPVGLGVELGVAQRALFKDQRDCLRTALHLGLEQAGNVVSGTSQAVVVPVDQKLTFLGLQKLNAADRLTRVGHHGFQESYQAPPHGLDTAARKEIAAVFD